MKKPRIKCQAPCCKEDKRPRIIYLYQREKPDFMKDAIVICERCGGYNNGKQWKYVCMKCKKEVAPGELKGLFVPHLCEDCLTKLVEKQKAEGNVCLMCRQPRCLCCC